MTARARMIVVLVALAGMLVISAMNLDFRSHRPVHFGCAPTATEKC